jgi:hypothetical protein
MDPYYIKIKYKNMPYIWQKREFDYEVYTTVSKQPTISQSANYNQGICIMINQASALHRLSKYIKVGLCVSEEVHTWILNQSLHSTVLLKHCNFLNSSKSRKYLKLCVKVIIQVTLQAIFYF